MLSKRIKTIVGSSLLLAALSIWGQAATTRYTEIRSTLQPNTTGQGVFVGTGTIQNFNASTATVTTNLNVKKITETGTDIGNDQVIYSNGGVLSGDSGLTYDAATDTLSPGKVATSTMTCSSCTLTSANIVSATIGSFTGALPAGDSKYINNPATMTINMPYGFTATTGTMTGALAMGANKITGIADGTAATDSAAFGQLFVSTAIQGTSASDFSTTSATPVTITGCTVTIVPKSVASKLKVTFSFMIKSIAAGNGALIGIFRDGNLVKNVYYSNVAVVNIACSFSYIISPATASSTTIDIRGSMTAGGAMAIGDGTEKTLIVEEYYK